MANVKTKIILRNDDLSNWISADPKLAKGEIGLARLSGDLSSKYEIRIGDGTSKWNELSTSNIIIQAENVAGLTASIAALSNTISTNIDDITALETAGDALSNAIAANTKSISVINTEIESIKDTTLGDLTTLENKLSGQLSVAIKEVTAEGDSLKTYELTQGTTSVGKINIPKDFLVKSAEVKSCTIEGQPVADYVVGTKYLDFVINTKDGSETDQHLYVKLTDLVDVYTAGNTTSINMTLTDGQFTAVLNDSAVVESKIGDGAVTTGKIATDAVTSDKVKNGAIITDKLADSAVTTNKIADGNITTAKIATGAVTDNELAADSVITVKIADGNVTTAKLAEGAVTEGKLAGGAVTEGKLADGAVTAGKIANGVITQDKLAEELVTKINSFATKSELEAKANALGEADGILSGKIDANVAAINTEISAREAADNILSGKIDTVSNSLSDYAKVSAVNAIDEAYKAADVAINAKIDAVSNSLSDYTTVNAVSEISNTLTGEIAKKLDTTTFTELSVKVGLDRASADNKVVTSADLTAAVADLAGAMHFVGVKTEVPPQDDITYKSGDIILVGTKEYVFDGENWIELGDEALYAKAADLTLETDARISADNFLSGKIDEISANYATNASVGTIKSELEGKITAEETARKAADEVLSTAIDNKIFAGENGKLSAVDSLSVVKISQADYHNLIAEEKANDKVVYIVNNDGSYNMYGGTISELSTSDIAGTSEAANTLYVDKKVQEVKDSAISAITLNGQTFTIANNIASLTIETLNGGNAAGITES